MEHERNINEWQIGDRARWNTGKRIKQHTKPTHRHGFNESGNGNICNCISAYYGRNSFIRVGEFASFLNLLVRALVWLVSPQLQLNGKCLSIMCVCVCVLLLAQPPPSAQQSIFGRAYFSFAHMHTLAFQSVKEAAAPANSLGLYFLISIIVELSKSSWFYAWKTKKIKELSAQYFSTVLSPLVDVARPLPWWVSNQLTWALHVDKACHVPLSFGPLVLAPLAMHDIDWKDENSKKIRLPTRRM